VNVWISTDLDGTLLDHHDYGYAPALPALEACAKRAVPILLNTSKTLAETRSLHQILELSAPIVVENGSALIFLHNGVETQVFGEPRDRILDFIEDTRSTQNLPLLGFSDLGVDGIMQHTGLSRSAAQLAADRAYSEPFLWQGEQPELMSFIHLAAKHGLQILKGGRFYHLQGQTDKAKPLTWLNRNLNHLFTQELKFASMIALGDNHNDVAMLNLADYPVCVRSHTTPFPTLTTKKNVLYTTEYGPKGWNEAVLTILKTTI